MTSTSVRPSNYNQPARDPNTAAILSLLVPGLGQMYNGETRKGVLFICVAVLNLILFLAMLFNRPILEALLAFGASFHMKPNKMLLIVLNEAYLGSSVSFILMGFFLSYVGYAVRDAYDHAAMKRRRIYPDFVIELPEATSGSYIFHFSIMLALFVVAFFFIIPPMPKSQLTEIEFVDPQLQVVKQKQITKVKSTQTSKSGGKHQEKPVRVSKPASEQKAASQEKKAEQSHTPKPQAQPKQEQAHPSAPPAPKTPSPSAPKPVPHPMPTAQPTAQPMAQPAPHPMPTPMPRMSAATPSPAAPTPMKMAAASPSPSMMPKLTPSAMPSATPMPMAAAAPKAMSPSLMPAALAPSALPKAGGGASAMPTPMARPNGGGGVSGLPTLAPTAIAMGSGGSSGGGMSNFAPLARAGSGSGSGNTGFGGAVGPVAASSGGGSKGGSSSGGGGPVPVAMSGGGGGGKSGGSAGGGSSGPAPVRAGRGGGGGGNGWSSGPISITPSVPKGGSPGGGGDGSNNPDKDGKGPASQAANADIDFGPYMADLQRRIKRAWFPPRGQESRRVVVQFKVATGGELSGLRIEHSSGVAIADQAALQAVQNAAPFRPLPAGAPPIVDIQFTFDYNVFSGGRSF